MSVKNVQFTVAAHTMTALGFFHGEEISSATLSESVNADPTFVRRSLSKLSKAGLVMTKPGKSGVSVLARPSRQITLLDIYRASAAPAAFAIHSYPVEKSVRSVATSRNARRGFSLKLRIALREPSRK